MSDQRPREAVDCPSSSRLAEFVDGRLEGAALEAVVAHLDRCEDCREVVAASAELLESEEPAEVRRFDRPERPSRPWLRTALAVAAVLALAVVGVWRLDFGADAARLPVAELAASIDAPQGPWDEHAWSVSRGGRPSTAERDRAFRAGVLVVDLEVALGGRQIERAGRVTASLLELLEAQEGAEAALFLYRQIFDRLGTAEAEIGTLLELTASGDELLVELLPSDHYRLGKWSEAGRVSALSDGRLLGREEYRRELERLLDGELEGELEGELDDSDRALLEQIEARLPARDTGELLTRLIDSR